MPLNLPESAAFHEAPFTGLPLRDLGLRIAGSVLEPLVAQVQQELAARGLAQVAPHFYLSTEWGVPFDSISVAIPFYLAHPLLRGWHGEHTGMIEGESAPELLRYLRHEVGHVLNYAYRLYERAEWKTAFGDIRADYIEEYKPQAFHRDYVSHLPGWYAQKHPDEDWAETFAVWMTPGSDWHREYAGSPLVLAKLKCCEQLMQSCAGRAPLVSRYENDEDVAESTLSLAEYYRDTSSSSSDIWDGPLQNLFLTIGSASASALIQKYEQRIATEVYRWTGHFPERTRLLLRQMKAHAASLRYDSAEESRVIIALTALVTALAMTHVRYGRYTP